MKIKSWTGDEVDARVGMVVKTDKFSGDFKNATIVELHDDKSVSLTVSKLPISHRVWINTCTMLHCPFQVGDEVIHSHAVYGDTRGIISEERCGVYGIKTGESTGMFPVGADSLKHTNPSLRTSEEYKL